MRRSITQCIIAILCLSVVAPLAAQPTPEALGDRLAEGIRAGDAGAVEALIHPEVRDALPAARILQAVRSWLNREIADGWTVEVRDASQVESYDAASGTFDMGGLKLRFPVTPTHFLQLIAQDETTLRVGGEARTTTMRGPQTVDAIRRDRGRWWIVLPGL